MRMHEDTLCAEGTAGDDIETLAASNHHGIEVSRQPTWADSKDAEEGIAGNRLIPSFDLTLALCCVSLIVLPNS